MSFAGKTRFDPAALMLEVEFFIASISSIICLGITPAVKEITTVTILSTLVTCCLLRGGAMVDDPDLVEVMGADEDLVELGVVVHGVDIGPARAPVLVEVDVGKFRMLADNAVVVFTGVEILDEMVPDMPFPDDCSAGWTGRLNFNDMVR